MPHLDQHARIERAHIAELSRGARAKADRAENDARIRDRIERDAPAYVTDNDLAERDRADFETWARSKLSDEELHPDDFPKQINETEDE